MSRKNLKLYIKMKKIKKLPLFLLLAALATNLTFAQDVITKKSGEDIQAKVIEVTSAEIKYKKADNVNGPLFTILKSDVLLLRYQDGTKDVFNNDAASDNVIAQNSGDLAAKGKEDAKSFYKGSNSGAGWTAVTTIVTSPILGLIPAAICSSAEPADENLKYTNAELMKNNVYNQAYTEQAHKIKKKKIWSSFGISSGAWLLLILLL
jgi:hypothetical protein